MIKSVIWASMLDYPKHVCTTIFFDNCNFGCEFCQNKDISKMKEIDFNREILPKLIERQDFVGYVVLSGGECTIDPKCQGIIDILHEKGFKIGIHTNGYLPEFITKNIGKIGFIGMDIKNDFEHYDAICNLPKVDIEKIQESMEIIIQSGIEYEFRTTVYPNYVGEENCIEIAKYLQEKKAKNYTLQQYKKVEGISDVNPYTEEKMVEIQKKCNEYIRTNLRGIQ